MDPAVAGPLARAASIRLYEVVTGDDWTAHIPLTHGYTVRLQVRLYAADGRQIQPLQDQVAMSFVFTPDSLATAVTADSLLLLEDVTPTASVGTGGNLNVTLTAPAIGTTKTFGPFSVLVH